VLSYSAGDGLMPSHKNRTYSSLWKLFKSGLDYNRVLFISLFCLFLPLFVLNAISGSQENSLVKLMILSVGIIGLVAGSEESKYKYNRLESSLPLPIQTVGLNRFPLLVGYWMSLMLILLISHAISRGGNLQPGIFRYILALSGLFLCFVSWICINFDVGFYFYDKTKTFILRCAAIFLALFSAALAVFLTEFLGTNARSSALSRVILSPLGTLGLVILGMGLSAFSVAVYKRRRSFVE
jgi:hypothetical protein